MSYPEDSPAAIASLSVCPRPAVNLAAVLTWLMAPIGPEALPLTPLLAWAA